MDTRLQEILNYTQMSPAEFAERIQVQRSSISHILNGRNKPSLDFLTKVKEQFPEISWDWLILGQGAMTDLGPSEKVAPTLPKANKLPLNISGQSVKGAAPQETADPSHLIAPAPDTAPVATPAELPTAMPSSPATGKTVSRVLLFFTDGTFESYQM